MGWLLQCASVNAECHQSQERTSSCGLLGPVSEGHSSSAEMIADDSTT